MNRTERPSQAFISTSLHTTCRQDAHGEHFTYPLTGDSVSPITDEVTGSGFECDRSTNAYHCFMQIVDGEGLTPASSHVRLYGVDYLLHVEPL